MQLSRIQRSLLFLLLFAGLPNLSIAQDPCGIERQKAKVLSSQDTADIDFGDIRLATVGELARLPKISVGSDDPRHAEEKQVYRVTGYVTDYKREDDKDIHIVLKDISTDSTIIIELPSTLCPDVAATSRAPLYDSALAWFKANVGNPTTSFKKANKLVTVEGISFFDKSHGQRGLPANCLELHPIWQIGEATARVEAVDSFTASVVLDQSTKNLLRAIIRVSDDQAVLAYQITDSWSRVIQDVTYESPGSNDLEIDITNLASGVYFITFRFPEGAITKKFIHVQ